MKMAVPTRRNNQSVIRRRSIRTYFARRGERPPSENNQRGCNVTDLLPSDMACPSKTPNDMGITESDQHLHALLKTGARDDQKTARIWAFST
jgi:hypothetical protein